MTNLQPVGLPKAQVKAQPKSEDAVTVQPMIAQSNKPANSLTQVDSNIQLDGDTFVPRSAQNMEVGDQRINEESRLIRPFRVAADAINSFLGEEGKTVEQAGEQFSSIEDQGARNALNSMTVQDEAGEWVWSPEINTNGNELLEQSEISAAANAYQEPGEGGNFSSRDLITRFAEEQNFTVEFED